MGTIPKGGRSSLYLNVNNGCLVRSDTREELGGYDGYITGIRVKTSTHKDIESNLEIAMTDPDIGEHVIISGSLVYRNGRKDIALWAQMLLKRLVSKENNLQKNTRVAIGVYPGSGERASNLISLRLSGVDEVLPGKGKITEYEKVMQAIAYLEERYGTIADRHDADSPDVPPPPSEPEYDNSNRDGDDPDLPF
jgi:hypothetical protein